MPYWGKKKWIHTRTDDIIDWLLGHCVKTTSKIVPPDGLD